MQLFKHRQTDIFGRNDGQKRFLSIVLIFFSMTFFYFGYRHFSSARQSASLKRKPKQVKMTTAKNAKKSAATEQNLKPQPFASLEKTDLALYFPAYISDIVGVGFHESGKPEAITLQPVGRCLMRESTETVSKSATLQRFPVLFVMYSRGRRQTPTSAVDVAVRPDAMIRSPVNGVITKIQTYYLYRKYLDFRVEIQPDNHPELRVAMIHLDKLVAKAGERVSCGTTEIGKARDLSTKYDSQINEYIPGDYDHTHIQVNRYVPQRATAPAGTKKTSNKKR